MIGRVGVVGAALLLAGPAGAQQELPRRPAPRGASLDTTVKRLVEELEANRARERVLARQLDSLRAMTVRGTPAAAWAADSTGTRRLLVQLRDVGRGIFRTQAQLMALCARASGGAPGWIGITFENQSMLMRQDDGRTTLQFIAYPRIVDVAPGSPAAQAGIAVGDSLLELGATDVTRGNVRFDAWLKPGVKLPVVVRRGGERKAMSLVVAKRPDEAPDECARVDRTLAMAVQPVIVALPEETEVLGLLPRLAPRQPRPVTGTVTIQPVDPGRTVNVNVGGSPGPGAASGPLAVVAGENGFTYAFTTGDYFGGAELRRLSPELAELTGTDDGVFVVSVPPQGPAAEAGLKPGDVIVRANELPIVRPDQLGRVLRESDDGQLKLTVVRKRARQVLTYRAR